MTIKFMKRLGKHHDVNFGKNPNAAKMREAIINTIKLAKAIHEAQNGGLAAPTAPPTSANTEETASEESARRMPNWTIRDSYRLVNCLTTEQAKKWMENNEIEGKATRVEKDSERLGPTSTFWQMIHAKFISDDEDIRGFGCMDEANPNYLQFKEKDVWPVCDRSHNFPAYKLRQKFNEWRTEVTNYMERCKSSGFNEPKFTYLAGQNLDVFYFSTFLPNHPQLLRVSQKKIHPNQAFDSMRPQLSPEHPKISRIYKGYGVRWGTPKGG
eukprot:CAMPEP_0194664924 /NCGR_PEP_ID=MMETSP0295-20121207/1771_1 /TAXON_ID=39354 /ORGANISM="Heterosigma akashiwo, Strain CCMP2393" /LENGTH=268 /DNA_ID=CAMNT_0039546799 /DNA_START=84 /DNA_END=890 /DNA_ORIENTATION=+